LSLEQESHAMNKPSHFLRRLLAAAFVAAVPAAAIAEDIDIYTTGGTNGDRPNVLLMLDNSANWSATLPGAPCYYYDNGVKTANGPKGTSPGMEQGTKMAIEKCALYNVIDALPTISGEDADHDAMFNVGIMLLNESPSSINGAYPRLGFLPVTTNNKKIFKSVVSALSIGDDKGNNAAYAKAMYEMYLYFKGRTAYKGNAGTEYDTRAFSGNVYISPSSASCARNHIIFIGNGSPQGAENNDALALLAAAGGSTSPIVYPSSYVSNSDQANWADEFARFMRGVDVSSKDGTQGITTHTVAVTGSSSDGTFPNFMLSMANHGGGSYTAASTAETLTQKLLDIFDSVESINSVFASASLPVAVNARGTYLNQVYMGVFRPDANGKQRWRGNLKQYQFSADALGNLSLVDTKGNEAIGATGFIKSSAWSFWTTESTFWVNQLMGDSGKSDAADGDIVEKGGTAQRLRTTYATSQSGRNVLTCVGCAVGTVLGSDSTKFATGNSAVTAAALGAGSSTERENLINWVRGTDNAGDELGPGGTTTIRPSVHGDVLHSRPAVINYGGSIGVAVFYGANDGMLHAMNGNQTGSGAGEEMWSFVPEEMFGKLKRLRSNAPEIKLSTTTSTSAQPRDYFVDGPIGVYQRIRADGTTSRAIIFVGMRRGGEQVYAFDVSDPAQPVFLWKKTSADLPGLAQSWSEPRVGRVRGHNNPVVVFGGGYDAAAEDELVPGTTTKGNAVFVLDAFTGAKLRAFDGIQRSVAADVALLDTDADGFIDRAYAVDLGGQVWRIDFETTTGAMTPADWTLFHLADLSGGTLTGRKFFFPPSVVLTKNFAALNFGSGDREKPLMSATQDHFFSIFDRQVGKGVPADATLLTWSDLASVTDTATTKGGGCYVTLLPGEKVVNAAATIGGKSLFGTHQPKNEATVNTCTGDLGTARGYAMPLFCVQPTSKEYPGGGMPPGSTVGKVIITGSDGTAKEHHFYTGGDNDKGSLDPTDPNIKVGKTRKRVYWYQETNR
jgi:type IV pilus assembly protein PilY1